MRISPQPLCALLVPLVLASSGCDREVEHELEPDELESDDVRDEGAVGVGSSALAAAHEPLGDGAAASEAEGLELSIAKAGADIALEWPSQGEGETYEVWVSEVPGFTPEDAQSQLLADAIAGTELVDVGGNDSTTRYYRARLESNPQVVSATVGKIATPLEPGYTKIGLCVASEVETVADLFADLGSPAISAHMWNAGVQDWDSTWASGPIPMPIAAGQVVSVLHDSTATVEPSPYTMVGRVPVHGDVRLPLLPGDNLVTMLPSRDDLQTASAVLAAVEHATRIGRWDASTQTTSWYPDDADFDVSPCMPLHVEVSDTSTWPPTVYRRQIGPAGGTIEAYDGLITLSFPPGALSEDTEIQISPDDYPLGELTITTLELQPHDIEFAVPVTLTHRYRPPSTEPGPFDELAELTRYSTDGTSTTLATVNDLDAGTLTAMVDTFSWVDTGTPCDASYPTSMTITPADPLVRVGEPALLVAEFSRGGVAPVVPPWTGPVTWDPIAADPVAFVIPEVVSSQAQVFTVAPGVSSVSASTQVCRIVQDPLVPAVVDQVLDWPLFAATALTVPDCAQRIGMGECPSDGCTIACAAGVCDGVTPINEGGACGSDGNACTQDACVSGVCTHGGISCNDGNACTADGCDPATGCTHAGISCNDGNACTSDGCDPATGCTHVGISCDDGNICTDDFCDGGVGCVHPINVPCLVALCFFAGICTV